MIEEFAFQTSGDKNIPGLWVLISSPKGPCTILDRSNTRWPGSNPNWPDHQPIESFKTGFKDTAPQSLQEFILKQKVVANDESLDPWARRNYDKHIFVVLDARSARDKTALMYHFHTRMPKELLLKDEDFYDKKLEIHEWVEWRVKFRDAARWASGYWFMNNYNDFEITPKQYIADKGVLQLVPERQSEGEEQIPLGPEVKEKEWLFPESEWLEYVEEGLIKVYPYHSDAGGMEQQHSESLADEHMQRCSDDDRN